MRLNFDSKTVLKILGGTAGGILVALGAGTAISKICEHDDKSSEKCMPSKSSGYDAEGFNREGFDKDGFDRNGFNKRGYNREGFDADGFNRYGRDAAGYNRAGYGLDGFNRDGWDFQGYGRNYYNYSGVDRAGYCRQFYTNYLERLRQRLNDAKKQLRNKGYRYAIQDARLVLEETLTLLIQHNSGKSSLGNTMLENLKICERKHLLDIDMIDKLHGVRKICNNNGHEFGFDESLTHNKVHFVVMQVNDLLNEAENRLTYV